MIHVHFFLSLLFLVTLHHIPSFFLPDDVSLISLTKTQKKVENIKSVTISQYVAMLV